jgi:glycosyltransferase involved in cell wall biosynthesis
MKAIMEVSEKPGVARRLAVLIPVFNNPCGLRRTLASLEPERPVFDIIVVDDGSRPPLPAALCCGDHRVIMFRQNENAGITGALNCGLNYVLSHPYSFVARIDAGDTAIWGRMQKQMTFLEGHPKCGVVSSFADFVDTEGRFIHRHRAPMTHEKIMRQMHINNCILHATAMIRVESLRVCGGYSDAFGVAGEDYELFLRMSKRYELAVIPEVLTNCEDSELGISVANRKKQQRARFNLQKAYFDPLLPHSYYGILRTLVAVRTPRALVLLYKRRLRTC